jgi:CheY-like chemotaxis protein
MAQPKVILFADDDAWFVQPFVNELEETGYRVLQTRTLRETLAVLSKEQVDLLVLDIMMPTGAGLADSAEGRRAGIKVAEFVRREMKANLPIVYLTVISDQAVHGLIELIEREAGLRSRILVKPVLPQELVEEVKDCLGEP